MRDPRPVAAPSRAGPLVALLWLAATAFGLAFAALTKIGPVVLTLSSRHGVHAGDLVALIAAYTVAARATPRLRPARARQVVRLWS